MTWKPFHNPYYGQLAKRLHDLFGYDKFVALTSGAEAADAAVKIARKWGYLQKRIPEGDAWVLTAGRCYHGVTLSTVPMRSGHQKSPRKSGEALSDLGGKVSDGCHQSLGHLCQKSVRYRLLEEKSDLVRLTTSETPSKRTVRGSPHSWLSQSRARRGEISE